MMTTTRHQTTTIPAPRITDFGFWGSMKQQSNAAWPLAITAIAQATDEDLETVRDFLDSRHGRHFADDVLNELDAGRPLAAAINVATQRWMGWTIGRQTSKDYGIPKGLPYLTGFVVLAGFMAEGRGGLRVPPRRGSAARRRLGHQAVEAPSGP